MERDHTKYFGRRADSFTILGRFEIQPTRLAFGFDTGPDVGCFDAGDAPLARLQQPFTFDIGDLSEDHLQIVHSIILGALTIADVGGRNWTLTNMYLSASDKVLVITAISPEGDSTVNMSFSGPSFDATLQANQQLVGAAIGLAWALGAEGDEYLKALTAV